MWRPEFLDLPCSRVAQAETAKLLYCALAFLVLHASIDPNGSVMRRFGFLRALGPALHDGELSSRENNPGVSVSQ